MLCALCLCCRVPLTLAVCRRVSTAKCKGNPDATLKGGCICVGIGMPACPGAVREGRGCSKGRRRDAGALGR